MEKTPVSSSNVAAIGYDSDLSILEVEFHHGGTYQYNGVPVEVYNDLMAADSKGTYLNQNIKNVYGYSKV